MYEVVKGYSDSIGERLTELEKSGFKVVSNLTLENDVYSVLVHREEVRKYKELVEEDSEIFFNKLNKMLEENWMVEGGVRISDNIDRRYKIVLFKYK